MKKMGFSLAEALITMAVIGVVAALALPQFTANVHSQSNAAKLSPVITDYENIFGMMLLKEDHEDIFETEFGSTLTGSSEDDFRTKLENYTKVTRTGDAWSDFYGTNSIKNINGSTVSNPSIKFGLTVPAGAILAFTAKEGNNKNYATLYIDVNGSSQPNRYGRDIFAFVLAPEGHLYPYGSRQASKILSNANDSWNNSSNANYSCSGSDYNGLGCTARLIENNYKVDY